LAPPRPGVVNEVTPEPRMEDVVLSFEIPHLTLVGNGLDLLDHVLGDREMTSPALMAHVARIEVDQNVCPTIAYFCVHADPLSRGFRHEATEAEGQDGGLGLETLELGDIMAGAQ